MAIYTAVEQDILDSLTMRQWRVLPKIAKLIGSHVGESCDHTIPLEVLIGKGYDDFDSKRILKIAKGMKSIVRNAFLKDCSLVLSFHPEAVPIIRKMALQAAKRPVRGDGEAYCEAILALKMAMDVKSDAEFTWKFDHEDFNFGDDTSYMAPAFNNTSWHVSFEDKSMKGVRRHVGIWPLEGGRIEIIQTIQRGGECCSSESLGILTVGAFINPEERERLFELARRAGELLKKVQTICHV